MAILVIRRGFNKGATYRLGQRSLTIGRDQGNMVQIVDDRVSRRHAHVRWTGSEHVIVDLQSHNGVCVNGQRVSEAPLRPGDVVLIGDTELEVAPDQPIASDAVLGRKIVDRQIVGAETRSASKPPPSPQESIAAGEMVDVDRQAERRGVLAARFLAELAQAIGKEPPADCQQRAVRGLGRLIQPDRCFLLRVTPERKGMPVAWALDPALGEERGKAPVYLEGIHAVVRELRPVRINVLPPQPGAAFPLGSMAAVPITNAAGNLAGVVYLDSFAEEARQAFVDDDMDLMTRVARLLSGTLGSQI
jgi:hypothetical protein